MIILNVVKPENAERLANAKKRISAAKRRTYNTNPATARTVAAAIAANKRAGQRRGWRIWR